MRLPLGAFLCWFLSGRLECAFCQHYICVMGMQAPWVCLLPCVCPLSNRHWFCSLIFELIFKTDCRLSWYMTTIATCTLQAVCFLATRLGLWRPVWNRNSFLTVSLEPISDLIAKLIEQVTSQQNLSFQNFRLCKSLLFSVDINNTMLYIVLCYTSYYILWQCSFLRQADLQTSAQKLLIVSWKLHTITAKFASYTVVHSLAWDNPAVASQQLLKICSL